MGVSDPNSSDYNEQRGQDLDAGVSGVGTNSGSGNPESYPGSTPSVSTGGGNTGGTTGFGGSVSNPNGNDVSDNKGSVTPSLVTQGNKNGDLKLGVKESSGSSLQGIEKGQPETLSGFKLGTDKSGLLGTSVLTQPAPDFSNSLGDNKIISTTLPSIAPDFSGQSDSIVTTALKPPGDMWSTTALTHVSGVGAENYGLSEGFVLGEPLKGTTKGALNEFLTDEPVNLAQSFLVESIDKVLVPAIKMFSTGNPYVDAGVLIASNAVAGNFFYEPLGEVADAIYQAFGLAPTTPENGPGGKYAWPSLAVEDLLGYGDPVDLPPDFSFTIPVDALSAGSLITAPLGEFALPGGGGTASMPSLVSKPFGSGVTVPDDSGKDGFEFKIGAEWVDFVLDTPVSLVASGLGTAGAVIVTPFAAAVSGGNPVIGFGAGVVAYSFLANAAFEPVQNAVHNFYKLAFGFDANKVGQQDLVIKLPGADYTNPEDFGAFGDMMIPSDKDGGITLPDINSPSIKPGDGDYQWYGGELLARELTPAERKEIVDYLAKVEAEGGAVLTHPKTIIIATPDRGVTAPIKPAVISSPINPAVITAPEKPSEDTLLGIGGDQFDFDQLEKDGGRPSFDDGSKVGLADLATGLEPIDVVGHQQPGSGLGSFFGQTPQTDPVQDDKNTDPWWLAMQKQFDTPDDQFHFLA